MTSSRYRKLATRKEPYVEVSLKVKDKDGKEKYSLEASNFDLDEIKEKPRDPIPWKKVPLNKNCYLIFGRATRDSLFTINGELVCKLVFKDNRVKGGLRLRPGEITDRDFRKLAKILKEEFHSSYDSLKKGEGVSTKCTQN